MQISNFSDGGFVIHNIPFSTGKLSAWYNKDSAVLDVEKFDKNGRATGRKDQLSYRQAARYGLRQVKGELAGWTKETHRLYQCLRKIGISPKLAGRMALRGFSIVNSRGILLPDNQPSKTLQLTTEENQK